MTVVDTTAPEVAPPLERLRDELALIEEKVVTGYTLADAIREGASVTEQTTGRYVAGNSACAFGAAWLAAKARGFIPS